MEFILEKALRLFNDLLLEAGISLDDVRLIRHHTRPGLNGRSLHDLWRDDRKGFELYQRVQDPADKLFRSGNVWAAFTSPEPGSTLFVGLYSASYQNKRVVDWLCPYRGDAPGGGKEMNVFDTQLRTELAEHIGTLRIEWDPRSVRTWARYAASAQFAVAAAASSAVAVPQLITDIDALRSNITSLEIVRNNAGGSDHAAYLGYVKRGTCFVPYRVESGLAFAPSRLLGYLNNDFARHLANEEKHGSHTNAAISSIVAHKPSPNNLLDRAYREFCRSLGFNPNDFGRFGHPRKFWRPFESIALNFKDRATPLTYHFREGGLYTRSEIADEIGLDERRAGGGAWLTGYAKVNGAFFLFANVGSSGRTGPNYPNRWDGKDLIWHGKSGTMRGQREMEELLSDDFAVHIFWRSKDRAAFTYSGLAAPVETIGAKPVQVRWRIIDNRSYAGQQPHLTSSIWRRGPPPATGTRSITRDDGPTSVYLMQLDGPISVAFSDLPTGSVLIKVGMSNHPERRLDDLSCGFPPGCALRWRLIARRELSNGRSAFALETTILEKLRIAGNWIGGEFAAIRSDEVERLARLE